jgi:hypothetical protein
VIVADASYRTTLVYGNVLIEPANDGNRQMVHYGGDSGTISDYRKGTLQMYNNTLISTRTDRTTLLRLSTNEETADFRNNIVYPTLAGNTVALLDQTGLLLLTHNWFKPGWVSTFGTLDGTILDDGTAVTGTSPGFVDVPGQDFRLTAGSNAINAGAALAAAVVPLNTVVRQYVKHQSSQARPSDAAFDIGAYEFSSAATSPCDLNKDSTVNVVDVQNMVNLILGLAGGAPGAGDLNHDRSINVSDLQVLVNTVIGASNCPT